MNFQFSEDDLEQVALEWFEGLGYTIKMVEKLVIKGLLLNVKVIKMLFLIIV